DPAARDGAAVRDPELFAFRYATRRRAEHRRAALHRPDVRLRGRAAAVGRRALAGRAARGAGGVGRGRPRRPRVLTSTELVRFLDGLLAEADRLQRRPPSRRTGPIPSVQSLAGAGRNGRNRRPGR
ncbi:hypothetical protein, partial [Actinomadura sp. CNU-125]|uniref:hypothetical protein n=1 Tax=Actinomadura sp. CNU-125 TaxID=1904961 RepID=UPI0013019857